MAYVGPDFVNGGPPAINAANLNGMVDELERLSPIGNETLDIRNGADSTVYPSAGDAVRGQINILKGALNIYGDIDLIKYTKGGCIATNVVGTTVSYDVIANDHLEYAVVDITGYKHVVFNGTGWTTGRLWAFVDANDKIISNSQSNLAATNLVVPVPSNAKKLISTMFINTEGVNVLGTPEFVDIEDLNDKIIETSRCDIIEYNPGGVIKTNIPAGQVVDYTVEENTHFQYAIVSVEGYEKVMLNGTGWTTGRLWAFVDEDNKLIDSSQSNLAATNLVVPVPNNAKKLISSMWINTAGTSYLGVPQYVNNNEYENRLNKSQAEIGVLHKNIFGNLLYNILSEYTEKSDRGVTLKFDGYGNIIINGTPIQNGNIVLGTIPLIEANKYYSYGGCSAESVINTSYWLQIDGVAAWDNTVVRRKVNTDAENAVVKLYFKTGNTFNNIMISPIITEVDGNSIEGNINKLTETEILQQFNNSINISGVTQKMAMTSGFDIDADGNLYVGSEFGTSYSEQTPGDWTANLIIANIGDIIGTKQVIPAFTLNEYCEPLDGYMKDYQFCCAKKISSTEVMVYAFCFCNKADGTENYNVYVAKVYNLTTGTFGPIQLMDIDVLGTVYSMLTINIVGEGVSQESKDNFEAIWAATGIEHPAGYGGAIRWIFTIQINPAKYGNYWYAACGLGAHSHALCRTSDLLHWEYVCDIPFQQATEEVAICIYNDVLYATSRGNRQVDGQLSKLIKCPMNNLTAAGWSVPLVLDGCRGERPTIAALDGYLYVLQCIGDVVTEGHIIPRAKRRAFVFTPNLELVNFIDLDFNYPMLHPIFYTFGGSIFSVISTDKRCYAVTTNDGDGRSDLSFTRIETKPFHVIFNNII